MDQAPPASDLQSPSALAQNTVVASGSGTSNVPVGAMLMYGALTPPVGWLVCDGSSLNRATYASLFAILGVTFGNVDGATFNLPDLRGRVPVCLGTNASVSALAIGDGQAVANRRPQHRTSFTDPGHTHNIQTDASANKVSSNNIVSEAGLNHQNNQLTDQAATGITIGTGNANDVLDTPSFLVVNFIIKY